MNCCSSLADYYLNGNGVHRDEAMAVALDSRVCNGPVESMTQVSCARLGDILVNSPGDREQFMMGIKLLAKSCSLGNQFGCTAHDRLGGTRHTSNIDPPKGAIGYNFGWSIDQSKLACTELHGKWQDEMVPEGRTATCEMYVPALDRRALVSLGFIADHLLWFSVKYEPNQVDAVKEFTRVSNLLVNLYGLSSRREVYAPAACANPQLMGSCLNDNRAQYSMIWGFQDSKYSIVVVLRSSTGERIELGILYTSPGSDQFMGNPGL
jgi:hypothetical protein